MTSVGRVADRIDAALAVLAARLEAANRLAEQLEAECERRAQIGGIASAFVRRALADYRAAALSGVAADEQKEKGGA